MKHLQHLIRRTIYLTLARIDRLFGNHNHAVILVFHAIDNGGWFYGNSQAQLETFLNVFAKKYKFISLSQMLDVVEKKQNYLEPVMSIVFDDGYHNIMSIAPLLKNMGVKPTIFALSDPENVNRKELETQHELLTDSELVILHRMFGWEVGSHTATHENLSKLSPKELQKQIHDSRQKLGKLLETEIKYFAYPKGSHSKEVVNHVIKAGYKAAFTMDHQEIILQGDLHRIPRIGINRTYTPTEALASISPSVIMFRKFMTILFKKTKFIYE